MPAAPESSAATPSGCFIATVYGSNLKVSASPYFSRAYICMVIAGIEILMAVTAILSASVTSSSDLKFSELVFRYIGCELIDPTPTTSCLPLTRSHRVSIPGMPPEMNCAEPDRSASLTAPDPLILTQFTFSSTPAAAAFFSIISCFSITISARKPTPSPRVMVLSLTSASADEAKLAAKAANAAASNLFMSFLPVESLRRGSASCTAQPGPDLPVRRCHAAATGSSLYYNLVDSQAVSLQRRRAVEQEGRVAMANLVVAGAGSGIGRGIAQRCAREGWRVAALDLDPAGIGAAPESQARIEEFACDIRDRAGIGRAVADFAARNGPVGALIVSAGVLRPARLAEMSDEDYDLT